MFFLALAITLQEKTQISPHFEGFKTCFRNKMREFCSVEGMVSLRWFKNYFLQHPNPFLARNVLMTLKQAERAMRVEGKKGEGLPNLLEEALSRVKHLLSSSQRDIYFRFF